MKLDGREIARAKQELKKKEEGEKKEHPALQHMKQFIEAIHGKDYESAHKLMGSYMQACGEESEDPKGRMTENYSEGRRY